MRERFPKVSQRRACALVGVWRSSCRYQAQRKESNERLTAKLKECALERPRYGYRRLAILVRKGQEEPINLKRVHRLYRLAGLALRKLKRKRLRRAAVPLLRLSAPNQEWAMDFVHDSALNGQQLRFFAVIDQFTRECVKLAVDTSMPSARVIRELEEAIAERGRPQRLRMDNGSEFTSRKFLSWCTERQIEMVHIRPGKPLENAHSESFNGRFREEFLNVHEFRHLPQARGQSGGWFRHYNEERPHSSLQYRTPSEFAAQCRAYSAVQDSVLAASG